MPIRHVLLSNDFCNSHSCANALVRAELSLGCDDLLGAGCYATVYQHPLYQDKVIKILKYRDRGYTAFVRAIMRFQDKGKPCPWLPHIYEATMFHVYNPLAENRRASTGILVVVLDRLVGDTVGRLTEEQREVIASLHSSRIWNIDSLTDRFEYLATCSKMKRQLKRAQKAITWAMHKVGASCDLHWGNIMFSPKTGQLVITDPLA